MDDTLGRSMIFEYIYSSHFFGQLPPASSWVAPNQQGAASPQTVNITGCVGFRVKSDKRIDNFAPCNKKRKNSILNNHDNHTMQADEHRRPSRDEADRFRICQGGKILVFLAGKPPDEIREHGIGLTVRNTLLGFYHPTYRGKRKNSVPYGSTHQRVWSL